MAKSKSVTIQLTDKQRKQIRTVTGQDHREIKVQAAGPMGKGKAASGLTAGKTLGVAVDSSGGPPTFPTSD